MNAQPKEQWISPEQTPKIYAAIAKVMAEIGKTGISKDRNNQQQGYKFRGIDDVYNALCGLLSTAGVCVLPRVTGRTVTERQTKSGGTLFYTVLDIEYDFVCAADGSKHTCAVVGEAMDSGDKSSNKAMSAGFKYACMQVFCIPTEGDNDADAHTHEVAARSTEVPGDLSHVPPEKAQSVADRMLEAMNADAPEHKVALSVLALHQSIMHDNELYMAASKLLTPKQRSGWREYVKMAKEPADKGAAYRDQG